MKRKARESQKAGAELSEEWQAFCSRGRVPKKRQRESALRCLGTDGIIRGFYSDIPLNPFLCPTHAVYPCHDHVTFPKDHGKMVMDARVINDMKTILSEEEFWQVVEHLYAVGIDKGKIKKRVPQRLWDEWQPARHYSRRAEPVEPLSPDWSSLK